MRARKTWVGIAVALCAACLPGGCPPEDYANALAPTLVDITKITGDTTLTAQQKRVQLEALGLSPSTINFALRDQRTGNQYGGDLRTAYGKVVNGQLDSLTPDEVQIYADAASADSTSDTLSVTLNDTEAQAITDFLRELGLSTRGELEAYLDTPGNTVPTTIPDDALHDVFVDFDPALLLDSLP